jgi:hypothetical protein
MFLCSHLFVTLATRRNAYQLYTLAPAKPALGFSKVDANLSRIHPTTAKNRIFAIC